MALIKRIDQRYPSHAMRNEAGTLLSQIGDSYFEDKRRRFFLFPYSSRAPGVYEYLSTAHPTHPATDDALVRLAEIYEKNRSFQIAIDRHRDLILWAEDSPYRVASEAAIPRLRLADLDGPEYGRDWMLQALEELDAWVVTYGDHQLRREVDLTRVDCLQRLADNDMIVADFYRTVKNPEGARQHASRALEYARRAGNPDQLDEIRTFLEKVDEIERVDKPVVIRELSPQDIAGGQNDLGTTGPAELAPSTPGAAPPRRVEEKEGDDLPEGEAPDVQPQAGGTGGTGQ